MADKMLKTPAAAELLDVSERTLEKWRYERKGPVWIKVGTRGVRYRASEIERYLRTQTQAVA